MRQSWLENFHLIRKTTKKDTHKQHKQTFIQNSYIYITLANSSDIWSSMIAAYHQNDIEHWQRHFTNDGCVCVCVCVCVLSSGTSLHYIIIKCMLWMYQACIRSNVATLMRLKWIENLMSQHPEWKELGRRKLNPYTYIEIESTQCVCRGRKSCQN